MKKVSVLILFILLTITSCSRLDLAVGLANSYMTQKTDGFFDLSWKQSRWLKEVLAKDIARIKKLILPKLGAELFATADLLSTQNKFDSNTVMSRYNRLEEIFYEGLKVFTLTAKTLVDKLLPTQIEYFQKKADQKFLKMKENSHSNTYKKMKKNFDSWTGGMTSEQKEELKEFVKENPTPINEIVYHRQKLVHYFIKAYPDKINRHNFIERLFTNYQSEMSPNYKKIINEKNRLVANFFTGILNKMSDEQKQTLISTIKDRANQLLKISKS